MKEYSINEIRVNAEQQDRRNAFLAVVFCIIGGLGVVFMLAAFFAQHFLGWAFSISFSLTFYIGLSLMLRRDLWLIPGIQQLFGHISPTEREQSNIRVLMSYSEETRSCYEVWLRYQGGILKKKHMRPLLRLLLKIVTNDEQSKSSTDF